MHFTEAGLQRHSNYDIRFLKIGDQEVYPRSLSVFGYCLADHRIVAAPCQPVIEYVNNLNSRS